jgi:hypothetical protein
MLSSLDALADIGAATVLTGHRSGGAVEAVRLARAAGRS